MFPSPAVSWKATPHAGAVIMMWFLSRGWPTPSYYGGGVLWTQTPWTHRTSPRVILHSFLPFTVSALCFVCGYCHRHSLPSCWPATVHPWGSQSKWKTGGKWGLKQLSVAPVQLNGPQINAEQSWKKNISLFSVHTQRNCQIAKALTVDQL